MTAVLAPFGYAQDQEPEFWQATFDIGVDIDDVLHPWFNTAHQLCVAAGITNGVTPKTWKMADEYGCDKNHWVAVLEQATEDGTLYGVPPIPGAVEALRRLLFAGHRIHLVTARGTAAWQAPSEQKRIHFQTANWVDEYAVPHDGLIHFESDKPRVVNELGLDFFIDDGVHNFEAIATETQGCEVYLMTAPHNADYYTPFRLDSMDEFVDVINEASEKGVKA